MILAVLLVFCVVDHVMHHDEAYSGVHVGDIDCSGMTADQIVATLESTYGESYEEKNVYVFVSEEAEAQVKVTGVSEVGNEDLISVDEARDQRLMWDVTPETVSASFDVHATAAKAVEEGHGFGNIPARLKALFVGTNIDPIFNFGDAYGDFVTEVNETVGYLREDFDFWIEDGEAFLYMGHDGLMLNDADFKKQLIYGFLSEDSEPVSIIAAPEIAPIRITQEEAEVVVDKVNAAMGDGAIFIFENIGWSATPSTIGEWIDSKVEKKGDAWVLTPYVNIDKARSDLLAHVKKNSEEEAIQVQFSIDSNGSVVVHTDASGLIALVDDALIDLNVALFGSDNEPAQAGANAIDGEAVTVTIQSSLVPSQMTLDEAIHYGVVGEISTFTTSYTYGTASTETRNFNIHLAADLLNNSICKSGGTWSFHEAAGECNEENGFKEAGVIEEGIYSTSFGGGICQVATTVFNAVYDGGYYIDRRHNHTIYNSSYPAGRDAAVSWPDLDLIWSNDTASDVLVTTSHTEGTVTVTLWGVSPERKVSTSVSDWEEGEKHGKRYIVNESMDPTAWRVKSKGVDGRNITVERSVYDKNGERLYFQRFTSYYDATDEIIEHGVDYEIPKEDEDE